MLYHLIMLYGRENVWRYRCVLVFLALLIFVVGLVIFMLPTFGYPGSYNIYLSIPIIIEAVRSLFCALYSHGAGKPLRITRGFVLLFFAYLLLFLHVSYWGALISGFIAGLYLMAGASWRIATSLVVRFKRWRIVLYAAIAEFLLGVWTFIPFEFSYSLGQIYWDVGTMIMVYSVNLIFFSWFIFQTQSDKNTIEALTDPPFSRQDAIIHIWTSTGKLSPFMHFISRYIVALNPAGIISTGHATFELEDIYISHYPKDDIDRGGAEFTKILKATRENNVQGLFQPSYVYEQGISSSSNFQIKIPGVNYQKLNYFWQLYRQDTTYNLTYRNCSSVVATALMESVEGYLYECRGGFWLFLRVLFSPELWVASQLRKSARVMAWTPGLVLDYSRAISYLLALPKPLTTKN